MADNNDNAPKKSGLMAIVKAVAILSTLVIVQVVAAAFIIPTPQDTEELARNLAVAKTGQEVASSASEEGAEGSIAASEDNLVEMSIGQYSITRYNVEADKTVNIDFEVYGTVLATEQEEYAALFESNQNRIREQVNLTIHAAEPSELTDRGLGLIKRRILERTNRALGKPLVREVFLTRFNFVQR